MRESGLPATFISLAKDNYTRPIRQYGQSSQPDGLSGISGHALAKIRSPYDHTTVALERFDMQHVTLGRSQCFRASEGDAREAHLLGVRARAGRVCYNVHAPS